MVYDKTVTRAHPCDFVIRQGRLCLLMTLSSETLQLKEVCGKKKKKTLDDPWFTLM